MKLFQLDGPVYSILSRIADFLILSILYVVCCLPVVTIGAATTALAYASIKAVEQEGYPAGNFFKSFKMNFRQATLIWLPAIVFFGVIILNMFMMLPDIEQSMASQVIFVLNTTLLVVTAFVFAMVFPLLSRFQNTILQTIANAFIMTARCLPCALAAALATYLPLLLILIFPMFTIYIITFWCLLGFALSAYGAAYIYEKKIFTRFIS